MKEFKLKENEIKKLTNVKGGCIASDRITVDLHHRLSGHEFRPGVLQSMGTKRHD